jgi:hypothetical protein
MKRSFENIDVECWEERARLGTTWPTICLSHAELSRGREILEAIDELAAEAPVAKRKLTFKSSSRKRPLGSLRLRLVSERLDLRVMSITRDDQTVTVELTAVGLGLLRDAVKAWLNGSEDFGVSPDHADIKTRDLGASDKASLAIWFWGPTTDP